MIYFENIYFYFKTPLINIAENNRLSLAENGHKSEAEFSTSKSDNIKHLVILLYCIANRYPVIIEREQLKQLSYSYN